MQLDEQMAQQGMRASRRFADGAVFVGLADLIAAEGTTATHLAATIGDALGLGFNGPNDPQSQLLAYLRDKRLLLILDNLEHLLDGVDLLHELLQSARKVTVLATSRARLNLQAEWLIDLPGLEIPAAQVPVTVEGDPRFQAEMQGEYATALRLYQESLARFTALGDRWAMLLRLGNLGDIATAQGDNDAAQSYYTRALQLAYDLWAVPKMLSALFRIATVLAHRGAPETAIELLALPLQYPATEQAFRDRAALLLAELRAKLDPEVVAQGLERGQQRTLEMTVQSLLQASGVTRY
jgi:tetratricopeptide (TPR) repeat protein